MLAFKHSLDLPRLLPVANNIEIPIMAIEPGPGTTRDEIVPPRFSPEMFSGKGGCIMKFMDSYLPIDPKSIGNLPFVGPE